MRSQCNRVVVLVALLVVLPAVAVAERARPGAGRRLARRAVRVVGRACGVRFEVRYAERLLGLGGYVLVANHTSPLDIPALLVATDSGRFLAAAELFRVPLLRGAMRALGAVPIDRGRPQEAYARLDDLARSGEPVSVIAFPEGGIVAPGAERRFKNGPFRLAATSGVPVVPVAIRGSATALPAGARLRVRPSTVTVDILDPVPAASDPCLLRDRAEAAIRTALSQ